MDHAILTLELINGSDLENSVAESFRPSKQMFSLSNLPIGYCKLQKRLIIAKGSFIQSILNCFV